MDRLRARAAGLSPAALGIGLVVLGAVAWGTGIFYILGRAGLPAGARLATVDAIHAYAGIGALFFFGAKIVRIGWRRDVPGVASVTDWQRMVSWSLVILYTAVFVTGIAAFLPQPEWHRTAVNLHLLTSVWSLLPTTLHLLHHRVKAVPYLSWSGRSLRIGAGLLLGVVPAMAVVAFPRVVSPLALSGGGGEWKPTGLQALHINTLSVDGNRLVAAGDGVFTSTDGRHWSHSELPNGGPEADRLINLGIRPQAVPPPAYTGTEAHAHGGSAALAGEISSVSPAAGGRIYLATSEGVYWSPWADGPYQRVAFAGPVRKLAVEPGSTFTVWALGADGPYQTANGGDTWTLFNAGIAAPANAAAMAFFHDQLYVADPAGIYRFDPAAQSWSLVRSVTAVSSLDVAGGALYASAHSPAGGGVSRFDGHRWSAVTGLNGHGGHRASEAHAGQLVSVGSHLFATGTASGISSSTDGADWLPAGGFLGQEASAVIGFRGDLYAATADGVFHYPIDPAPRPAPSWWLGLILAGLGFGVMATGFMDGRTREPESAATPTSKPRRPTQVLKEA